MTFNWDRVSREDKFLRAQRAMDRFLEGLTPEPDRPRPAADSTTTPTARPGKPPPLIAPRVPGGLRAVRSRSWEQFQVSVADVLRRDPGGHLRLMGPEAHQLLVAEGVSGSVHEGALTVAACDHGHVRTRLRKEGFVRMDLGWQGLWRVKVYSSASLDTPAEFATRFFQRYWGIATPRALSWHWEEVGPPASH